MTVKMFVYCFDGNYACLYQLSSEVMYFNVCKLFCMHIVCILYLN